MNVTLFAKAAASVAASVAALCAWAPPTASAAAAAPMTFGVLAAACTSQRLGAERSAGITAVELPLAWDRFEPEPGRVNTSYVAEVRRKIAACRAVGIRVMLSSGVQYAPDWVRALPDALLRGSAGGTPVLGGLDLAFNARVRTAVHDYLGRLAQNVPLRDVTGMRIGVSGTGELAFPGPGDATAVDADGDAHEYWAFGSAPQTGAGLADGAAVTPMPGWRPGQRSWRGGTVTPEQADAWLGWYSGSLLDTVVWQVGRLRELGFAGDIHIPVAGRGILPADRAAAVDSLLDGRADPDGALERGLDYPRQFPVLAGLPGVVVDFTGLDDDSAVHARARGADRCQPGDTDRLLQRTDTADWPGQRFTTALARRSGLRLAGENPGPPGAPFTGGSAASDTSAQQLQRAPDYARDCGITEFYWAFENDLFTPGSGVDINAYAARIAAFRAASR